ncbi:MAG: HAMP domain-containing sensor histidine kinase [Leeuwenhoekiella sp.]
MSKNLFVLLIILMSLSLIGIIFVQGYWIANSIESKQEHFAFEVKQVLHEVAETIERDELDKWYYNVQQIIDSTGVPQDFSIDEYLYSQQDSAAGDTFTYRNNIVSQDYKLSSMVVDFEVDSIKFKKYLQRRLTEIVSKDELDRKMAGTRDRYAKIASLNDAEMFLMENLISEITSKELIQNRVSATEIKRLITMGLAEQDLETEFDFAVYSNNLATKVRSENFDIEQSDPEDNYSVSLFDKDSGNNYKLLANFPGEKNFVLSSVVGMALLSILFTLIIVVAYGSALRQLVKQRQISEIKTDFINNMTHEFKTPIATINLALDAVRNPKIRAKQETVDRYLGMIREENKRMHAQVENILRISKLEKNELDIKKERLKVHDLVEDAIAHIGLIIEDRGGYVKTHYGALKSSVLANDLHFTNVIVNILDNAIKYSSDVPKIDIYTENIKNFILIKISDQGDGMTKGVQKKIFQKFYREHTGDIHNVKGHGLGLAYARRIVEDHSGSIWVQSERQKGSTFIIKLPLIS